MGSHSLLQRDLPNPGIKPKSPALQADSLPSEPPGKPISAVGIHISLPFGTFLPIPRWMTPTYLGRHRAPSWASCTIQKVPASYLFYTLVAQLCSALCNPMDCSPPGSSVHGNLQARILEWVANPFSRGSSRPSDWTCVSCIAGRFFTTWATREAPFSHTVMYTSQCYSLNSSHLPFPTCPKVCSLHPHLPFWPCKLVQYHFSIWYYFSCTMPTTQWNRTRSIMVRWV